MLHTRSLVEFCGNLCAIGGGYEFSSYDRYGLFGFAFGSRRNGGDQGNSERCNATRRTPSGWPLG